MLSDPTCLDEAVFRDQHKSMGFMDGSDPPLIDGSGAHREDKFSEWLLSRFDVARWFQLALLVVALVSIADIAWELYTGTAEIYSRTNRNYALRANQPEAFRHIIAFEVLRTVAIVLVGWAISAVRKSVAHYDIFAPGQEFKSLDEEGKP